MRTSPCESLTSKSACDLRAESTTQVRAPFCPIQTAVGEAAATWRQLVQSDTQTREHFLGSWSKSHVAVSPEFVEDRAGRDQLLEQHDAQSASQMVIAGARLGQFHPAGRRWGTNQRRDHLNQLGD